LDLEKMKLLLLDGEVNHLVEEEVEEAEEVAVATFPHLCLVLVEELLLLMLLRLLLLLDSLWLPVSLVLLLQLRLLLLLPPRLVEPVAKK
jgi:hypothetical protein